MPKGNKKKAGNVSAMEMVPLARSRMMVTGEPSILRSARGGAGIRVKHREYVADVVASSTAFEVTKYPLNPGMALTHPWLAALAVLYERYSVRAYRVYYETAKSASTDGKVMIGIDFDALDNSPPNKQQLLSYKSSVSAGVWQEAMLQCSMKELIRKDLYVRCGSISSGDLKTYDFGALYVASQGASAATLGELYVEYDIEFSVPQTDISAQALCNSASVASGGTVSKTAIFGDAAVVSGGLDVEAAGSTLTFNRVGEYLLSLRVSGTGATTLGAFTGTATISAQITQVTNAASTATIGLWAIQVNNRGETAIVDASTFTTGTASLAELSCFAYSLA
jgi:hypothetical protein